VCPSQLAQFQGPRLPPPNVFNSYYQPSTSSQPGPSQTIYRGKLTDIRTINKSSTSTKGVRKHNHIPWTMTGLKRAETYAVVKEEKAVHTCDICGVKYEKYRSLEIHKRRIHNTNAKVECPEGCGKLLSSTNAIKKHLLSHRPEEEWPHECPLCHKKFQARGDIPKHLKTKIHENDSIPVMGTKEWFDLIYHDDPNYSYGAMKMKLEKQEARERSKLPPGMYPTGLINLEDPVAEQPVISQQDITVLATVNSESYMSLVPPTITYVEGLEESNNILESITPLAPVSDDSFNVMSSTETIGVFAEDGLFPSLGTQASLLL